MLLEDKLPEHPDKRSTYFAPADRLGHDQILDQINTLGNNIVVDSLIKTFGCVVCILNSNRQILAVNDNLLKFLGLPDAYSLLGLRPGEALKCVHSEDHPGGCGTSKFCSTCGAAISILAAQTTHVSQERECLLNITEKNISIELKVRAESFAIGDEELVLLMLIDIRDEKRRESLERTFFHDLNNVLNGLLLSTKILKENLTNNSQEQLDAISTYVNRLVNEVRCQQFLSNAEDYKPQLEFSKYRVSTIIEETKLIFLQYVKTSQPKLRINAPEKDIHIWTDKTLLNKVLMNMIKNALEASNYKNEVRFWCDIGDDSVTWNVQNQEVMPEKIALQIFQRYFSTKNKNKGHGLGTHSMKFFGERYLGGKVTFTSVAGQGTIFSFNHPIHISNESTN